MHEIYISPVDFYSQGNQSTNEHSWDLYWHFNDI